MKIKSTLYIILFEIILFSQNTNAQYLSNLNSGNSDPVYTTYAAAMERSEYKVNQAYHFDWYDRNKSITFESKQGGNLSAYFKMDNRIKTKIEEFHKRPVITLSYPDMVKFNFSPYKNINIEGTFLVYSSRIALLELAVTNVNSVSKEITIYPNIYFEDKNLINPHKINDDKFIFEHKEKPDGWMLNHNIPFQEDITNLFIINEDIDSYSSFENFESGRDTSSSLFKNAIKKNNLNNTLTDGTKILALQKTLTIQSNERRKFRILRIIDESSKDHKEIESIAQSLLSQDLEMYVKQNEKLFSRIPQIIFSDKNHEAVYWNSFSLIRQCMLPPEGESSYNYYVFSREPRWGWGYGGQVFHESLVMLAYAYMDPVSAMNSQRVYMERQREDGYINYRTGPYLNETIETNGQFTSSAPWYNWQNLEIFKITNDKKFLEEAYKSGKKFYEYYTANRDSDGDGLCEWGAHAVLESVRDARVAVWDEVADPINFEGLDLNIMLVNEANSLSQMATILGMNEDAVKFKDDAEKRKSMINELMWDDDTKFYYQITKDDHTFSFNKENDLKRKEIIAFLALWANVADEKKAEYLIKHLTDEKTFWRKYGIPTLSADDSYYNPIGYWNGPIWIQWQYLILRGLINYGYNDLALELTNRVLKNISYQLSSNHWFWEFYSADDLQAGWNKTYIWTGIAARMILDIEKLK